MAEKSKTSRRPRVSHTEATNRLIDATIKLAGSQPMSDITVGIIAAEADLRSGSVLVKRYFGFRKDLLQAAASKLTNQIIEMLENPRLRFPTTRQSTRSLLVRPHTGFFTNDSH
jgi:AcrR family transcriptional regulator